MRQWCKQDPTGGITPEGYDDVSIEYSDKDLWVQVKSRNEGYFTATDIEDYYQKSLDNAKAVTGVSSNALVITERSVDGKDVGRLENNQLNSNTHLYCDDPLKEILNIIKEKLDILDGTAFSIATCLYFWVAHVSRENGKVDHKNRIRLTQGDLTAKINSALESGDISHLDKIIEDLILVPVDFDTPIEDENFYTGVKVQPGHVCAGLVFDRVEDVHNCQKLINKKRQLLITAPSGSGKSALMWLLAKSISNNVTWYKVSCANSVSNINKILRFVRVFNPTQLNPIGIVVDDVSSENVEIWNALSDELGVIPGCFLLGSVRTENKAIIKPNTYLKYYTSELSELLAQDLWNELKKRNLTIVSHWKESFEQSSGLILEYVHFLTQGESLRSVIRSQVHEREQEGRLDEIKILRAATLAASLGGEIAAEKLINALEIDKESATLAFKRLLDEHLISEIEPGIVGGLHDLRSKVLFEETHDEVLNLPEQSFDLVLATLTLSTFPKVVRNTIAQDIVALNSVYSALQKYLLQFNSPKNWIAVFEGLKATSLDNHVLELGECLKQHKFPKSIWHFAALFCDPKLEIPNVEGATFFEDLQSVYSKFRNSGLRDHRLVFVEEFKDSLKPPKVSKISVLVKLFDAWAPILGGKPVLPNAFEIGKIERDIPIEEVCRLLQSAYFYDKKIAFSIVEGLGGEELLLAQLYKHSAFFQHPTINKNQNGDYEICSNYYAISEQLQNDANDKIVEFCNKMMALSPKSNFAKCAAVDGDGNVIMIDTGFAFVEKNMPRENLPESIRISLNQEFIQAFKNKYNSSKTEYLAILVPLLIQTEKLFREFSEKWVKGKTNSMVQRLADTVNDISEKTQAVHLIRDLDQYGSADIPSLIINILKNIIPRMCKIETELSSRALPAYLSQQAEVAGKLIESEIWSYIENPPYKHLTALKTRLLFVSDIIHEIVDEEATAILKLAQMMQQAKGSSRNKAIKKIAMKAKNSSQERLRRMFGELKREGKSRGYNIEWFTKEINDMSSPFWPREDICIVVEVETLSSFIDQLPEIIILVNSFIKLQNFITLVPSMNKKIVSAFAFNIRDESASLNVSFNDDWQSTLQDRVIQTPITDLYEKVMSLIYQLSGLIACCDLEDMHSDEASLFDELEADLIESNKTLSDDYENSKSNAVSLALNKVEEKVLQLDQEREAKENGQTYTPMCCDITQSLSGELFDAELLELKVWMVEEEVSSSK